MRIVVLALITRLCRMVLKLRGIKLGRGGWVHGLPRVYLAKGSRVEIGDGVTLCSMARFNPLAPEGRMRFVTKTSHARIVIRDGVGISSSLLSCHTSITIGKNTLIGADSMIIDSDFHEIPLGSSGGVRHAPIEIGEGVFIGTRSIVLKGVTIGDGSVIGAGSVVSKNIPAHCIAAGNPAKVVRVLV
jgi:acetyltransferase-like isoleucine patch superfamily enzyme